MNYVDKFDLNSIPKLNENNTLFSKETNKGTEIFISSKMPQMESLELNATSRFILNNIKNNKKISDILESLAEEYPEMDKNILKNDLINFIKELYDMKYIYWEKDPFIESTKKVFGKYILMLDNIENIRKNIRIEELMGDDLFVKKLDLSEQRLEVLSLLKKEIFFSIKKDEEYMLVLRISNRFSGIWVRISYINSNFNVYDNKEIIIESIVHTCKFYKSEYEKKYDVNFGNKIMTYFIKYEDIKLYSSLGFELEGTIENAIEENNNYKNLYLMSFYL